MLVAPLLLQYASGQSTSIVVLDKAAFVDDLGFFHVIGEIKNTGSSPVRFVNMQTAFYDSSGAIVGTATGYPFITVIHTQEKSAFEIILFDAAKSSQVTSYSFDITSQPASAKPAALKLTMDQGFHDSLGFYHAVGTVENKGNDIATLVSMSAAFYDKNGKIAAVGEEYAESDLEVGARTSIEIIVQEGNVQAINTASVNVASLEYGMGSGTPGSSSQSSGSPPPSPAPSPQPTLQQAPQIPQAETTNSTITLGLDKTAYRFGEYITMSGNVTYVVPNENLVVMTVTFPGQAPYSRYTASLDSSGHYQRTFLFYGKADTEDQWYIVEAKYNGAAAYTAFLYDVETSKPARQPTDGFDTSILFTNFDSPVDPSIDKTRFQSASPIFLTTTILNGIAQETPLLMIIETRDNDGLTVDLQIIPANLPASNLAKVGAVWTPLDSGKYQVRMFAISDSDVPKALSSVSSSIISIG